MKISDLRIGTRLGASFTFVLVLMILLTTAGVWTLRDLVASTDFLLNDAIAKDRLVSEWRHNTELNSVRTALLVSSTDEEERAKVGTDMKATSARISELEAQLNKLVSSGTGKALYGEAHARRAAYREARSVLLQTRDSGGDVAAITAAKQKMYAALGSYLDGIGALARHQEKKAVQVAADTRVVGRQGELVQIGLCVAALVAAVACTVLVTRSITRPLGRATELAQEVAQGHLRVRDETFSRDETGVLLSALDKMTRDLRRLVSDVRDSSAAIASASGQIASGSQELSARTEEQASSLEETASSMEELTSTVKQTADNARQANHLATAASQVAVKGGQVVEQVVDKMASINASAGKITEIISVIDGIAFQTNILALNAAVEAARAGEQGRGFAVVATEVRNLAQRSASAAKEIKSLIEVSVQEVDAGSALVGKAGATMNEIVASVGRVSAIIRDISMASDEQEAGIAQINEAISQMDGVTQQNAALVEESAAAGESLLTQAQQMEQLVGTFQLDDAHSLRPSRHAPTAAPAGNARLRLAA